MDEFLGMLLGIGIILLSAVGLLTLMGYVPPLEVVVECPPCPSVTGIQEKQPVGDVTAPTETVEALYAKYLTARELYWQRVHYYIHERGFPVELARHVAAGYIVQRPGGLSEESKARMDYSADYYSMDRRFWSIFSVPEAYLSCPITAREAQTLLDAFPGLRSWWGYLDTLAEAGKSIGYMLERPDWDWGTILRKKVEPGMVEDAVLIAWGRPSETFGNRWIYRGRYLISVSPTAWAKERIVQFVDGRVVVVDYIEER